MKSFLIITIIFSSLLLPGCDRKYNFEFCFSSIVFGTIAVTTAQIGNADVPCGILSATCDGCDSSQANSREYNFEKDSNLCGSIADGYKIKLPDSAYLAWGGDPEGKSYQKRIKLPPFPPLKSNQKYQIGFGIGYQDCVYVRIKTVPDSENVPFLSKEHLWFLIPSAILAILFIIYLCQLTALFSRIPIPARKMHPLLVWINIIPGINLLWHFVTVIKLSSSLLEYMPASDLETPQNYGRRTGLLVSTLQVLLIAPLIIIISYPMAFIMVYLFLILLLLWLVFWLRYNWLLFIFQKMIKLNEPEHFSKP
jgi:hypothetical protein